MEPLDPVSESPIGTIADRSASVIVLLVAAGFVWFLLQLTPSPAGHGTHTQLGLPKCGWVVSYGKPCPTCGVTTSAAHLVRFQVIQAIKVQPFGASLAALGLFLAGAAAWCLVRRRAYLDFLQRLPQIRILMWGAVLLLASWAYMYATFEP